MTKNKPTYHYILGLDPSGSFNEGKGTTGWCVLDACSGNIIETGILWAGNYNRDIDYWRSHITLLDRLRKKYLVDDKKMVAVVEDYFLYAGRAKSQINSRFEMIRLLGILELYFAETNMTLQYQRATDVMTRWADKTLEHKGYIKKEGRFWLTDPVGTTVHDHQRDSIRHAVHFHTFYNTPIGRKKNMRSRNACIRKNP